MNRLISLISGIIFGIGLVISQMINPEKVLGFLDIFGNWDPSLAFVMIGALIISSPMFHLIKKRENQYLRMNLIIQIIKILINNLFMDLYYLEQDGDWLVYVQAQQFLH